MSIFVSALKANGAEEDPVSKQQAIEGLAYATLQPRVKELVARDSTLLQCIVKLLSEAPPSKAAVAYGALSIFANLTRYSPVLTEEQLKMHQLKAYANASREPAVAEQEESLLQSRVYVDERCSLAFDAGIVPVLVTQTAKAGSPASVALAVAIVYSISMSPHLGGPLSQQGAVGMLINAWSALPDSDKPSRRTAAQALARILIRINPALALGGNRPTALASAVRPLASILTPDADSEVRDMLPSFEALMALTNLASTEDAATRRLIVSIAWPHAEELMLHSNPRVARAAVELVCNLVQFPEGIALYAEGSAKAKSRIHIMLALASAEDGGTCSAAGGALASLTLHEAIVEAICNREGGVGMALGLCRDRNDDIRHRGVVVVDNMALTTGTVGKTARASLRDAGAIDVLNECARTSGRQEVVAGALRALRNLGDS